MPRSSRLQARLVLVKSKAMEIEMIASGESLEFSQHMLQLRTNTNQLRVFS